MKQNSKTNGTNTSVKVHSIVSNGITIEAQGNTYFLPYSSNPWFENAKVTDVFNVEPVGKKRHTLGRFGRGFSHRKYYSSRKISIDCTLKYRTLFRLLPKKRI